MAQSSTLRVDGMTCGHCVDAVRRHVGEIDGVQSVDIDLVPGGVSTVTVTGTGALDPAALSSAVESAGYSVV
jgi:copper chaperone CopZ